MGDRIVIRRCTGGVPPTEFPHPGEVFADLENQRFGLGFGEDQPRWYMAIDTNGDWFTDFHKFKTKFGDAFGFNDQHEWTITLDNASFLIGNKLGLEVKTDVVSRGDVYGQNATFSKKTKTADLEATGETVLRNVTFLGSLNLSLSEIAKGIIPTSYILGDVLLAGTGSAGAHAWKNPKALVAGTELGGVVLSNTSPGININAINGRYSANAEGYPVRGVAAGTLDDLVANLDGASYTRASTAGHFNADGVFGTNSVNKSRISFDFTTYEKEGLILEGPSKNSVSSSSVYGNAKLGQVVGPSGSNTGSLPDGWGLDSMPANAFVTVTELTTVRGLPAITVRIQGSNSTGSVVYPRISFVSGTAQATTPNSRWNASIYNSIKTAVQPPDSLVLRVGTTTNTGAQVDNPVSSSNILLTGGVINRFKTPILTSSVNSYLTSYLTWPVNNAQTVDFSIQIIMPTAENLNYAGFPYADSNKAGDLLTLPATPRYFRVTEGTVYIHFKPLMVDNNIYNAQPILWRATADPTNASTGNCFQLIQIENHIWYQVFYQGALVVNIDLGVLVAGNMHKIALTYKQDNFSAVMNGANAVTVDTTGSVPIVTTQWIGSDGTGKWLPLTLYDFRVIRRKFSDSELLNLVSL